MHDTLTGPESAPSLFIREWIAILVILVGFGLMTVFTRSGHTDSLPDAKPGYLWVEIEGAVRHPGAYQMPIGSTVQQAIDLAEALPDASYKGIRRNSVLKEGQLIRVRAKVQSLITIHLEGDGVNSGPFEVPNGTRLIDLIEIAPLKKGADVSSLERKRRLKPGEHVIIPHKLDEGP